MLAILTPDEDGGFVALNPETGTTTQGESIDEALAKLREAVELFLEEFPMKIAGLPFVTTVDVSEHA
jgi:predicted RNase H-like HicB family nuclease